MSRIRTVFLGTPEISRVCLESIIKDEHFEIVGVVSQPDRAAGRKMQTDPFAGEIIGHRARDPVFDA